MSSNDPVAVYLDLNHWYALGAALAGHPGQPDHAGILQKLRDQVDQGRLVFPLSVVHYMELTENPGDQQRREAADAMRLLSRFVTIASIGKIVDEDLAHELNRRFGRPAFPIKVPKFGVGAGFAFGTDLRLRPFEGIPQEQLPLLEARLGLSTQRFEAAVNNALEHSLLTTPSADRSQIPGYDPYSARKVADLELKSFTVMHETNACSKRCLHRASCGAATKWRPTRTCPDFSLPELCSSTWLKAEPSRSSCRIQCWIGRTGRVFAMETTPMPTSRCA